jgi:ATP-binding cassette subfamily C (CFTR/MRP) protein 1
MSAYETSVQVKADALREAEMVVLVRWRKQVLKVSIATNWLGSFLALLTVSTYTVVSLYSTTATNGVTTAKIFTVTSTVTIISEPLLLLGQRMGQILSAWASVKRIQEFLLLEEQVEQQLAGMESEVEMTVMRSEEKRILLQDASFGVKDKITVLNNLNVDLINPALWVIVGRVGCVSVNHLASQGS